MCISAFDVVFVATKAENFANININPRWRERTKLGRGREFQKVGKLRTENILFHDFVKLSDCDGCDRLGDLRS